MSKFPHTRFFPGRSKAVVISGPEIQVVNSQTGSILCSTANLEGDLRESLLKSGPIRCVDVDNGLRHVVTVGDDKKMKVWDTESLKVLSERELPKKPTEVRFTKDGQTILTADKFGDIFSYPLHPGSETAPTQSSNRPKFVSHDNPSGGKLILGHTSLLTTFLLTKDEKYIVTADRDEHIRVSWYPQGYNIESYCLGHEKFVSALHIPTKSPSKLISGGGDPSLKLWDWYEGRLQTEIRILERVEPYIKIKVPQGKGGRWDEDGDDGEEGGQRGRRRGRKGKGKSKADGNQSETPQPEGITEDMDVQMGDVNEEQKRADQEPELETILAIRRIATVGSSNSGEGPQDLVFSAIGATALFSCPYPGTTTPDTGQETADTIIVVCDLGHPVLDFVVIEDHEEAGALFWVLLDGEWGIRAGADGAPPTKMVRAVRYRNGEFIVLDEGSESPLLSSLNSTAVLSATPAQLSSLDLYAALSSLPKNTHADHDPMDRSETGSALGDSSSTKLGGKHMGKLKTRMALAAAMSESKQLKPAEQMEEDQRDGKKLKQGE
ncbi:WD40 repeat-like protein [Gloeophyllum trabeum ATCC 11539]|uniref:WD40 repeat-like protein n=1 Tax=Gloeophyllum trabeum (strain ATCC 11539 / FP-39264 / Madison 617) TaxID=670483 RepID=S7QB91_GLOTA|nr:WD40 repeat-like protein [Gloeophyllum trabeum ATCC 11539]EPQ56592.1 WD40 repeat-like protein [Gloeophyllum trabeum ATCC 11539]